MKISLCDRAGLLNNELQKLAERRIRFALSRFAPRIEEVSVVFSDENGPRGGLDTSCRFVVHLRGRASVVINHLDNDVARGISRASERAGKAVSRSIERSQSFSRMRPADTWQDSESLVR